MCITLRAWRPNTSAAEGKFSTVAVDKAVENEVQIAAERCQAAIGMGCLLNRHARLRPLSGGEASKMKSLTSLGLRPLEVSLDCG